MKWINCESKICEDENSDEDENNDDPSTSAAKLIMLESLARKVKFNKPILEKKLQMREMVLWGRRDSYPLL